MWQSASVFAACVLGPTFAKNNEIERKKARSEGFRAALAFAYKGVFTYQKILTVKQRRCDQGRCDLPDACEGPCYQKRMRSKDPQNRSESQEQRN